MGSPILARMSGAWSDLSAFVAEGFADFTGAIEALVRSARSLTSDLHWSDKSDAAEAARTREKEMENISFKAREVVNSTYSVEFTQASNAKGGLSWRGVSLHHETYDAEGTLSPKVDKFKRQVAAELLAARQGLRDQVLSIWPPELAHQVPAADAVRLEAPPEPVYTGPNLAAVAAVMRAEGSRFTRELYPELALREPADLERRVELCYQAPDGGERFVRTGFPCARGEEGRSQQGLASGAQAGP